MKYTAINIGPIVGTISMARKPREMWAASYLFSYLMECIINEIGKLGKEIKIVSPASLGDIENPFYNVGLYPDRVFVEGEIDNTEGVLDRAVKIFSETTGVSSDYVNIMYVSIEYTKKAGAIKELNYLLDCTELDNRPVKDSSRVKVLNLIQKKYDSPLFKHANGSRKFDISTLGEIATHKFSKSEKKDDWKKYCIEAREKDTETSSGEDVFYTNIKKTFKEDFQSYCKYICIVQADGDNMGKIVSALDTDKVKTLSSALLAYGSEASRIIESYGGLPVYAGGDDLLFIAPVVSDNKVEGQDEKVTNIFELLSAIDACYKSTVDDRMDGEGLERPKDADENDIHTSISYGLAISYYKYPLYEAWNSAISLLFDTAKNVSGKNAVAWCLRKHSGSGFTSALSKSDESVYQIFKELMKYSVDENLVSAIAHKLRANMDLLDILRNQDEDRMKAFYRKIMEEEVTQSGDTYVGATRRLLWALFRSNAGNEKVGISDILTTMYGMLRTAKFINGEGDNDE